MGWKLMAAYSLSLMLTACGSSGTEAPIPPPAQYRLLVEWPRVDQAQFSYVYRDVNAACDSALVLSPLIATIPQGPLAMQSVEDAVDQTTTRICYEVSAGGAHSPRVTAVLK